MPLPTSSTERRSWSYECVCGAREQAIDATVLSRRCKNRTCDLRHYQDRREPVVDVRTLREQVEGA